MRLIALFKHSLLGRLLKRISKRPLLGWPLRRARRLSKHPALNPLHYTPRNLRHNAKQAHILRQFEQAD